MYSPRYNGGILEEIPRELVKKIWSKVFDEIIGGNLAWISKRVSIKFSGRISKEILEKFVEEPLKKLLE